MKVLQISADRSARGILHPGSPAFKRQEAYAKQFGSLDVIGFSRFSDGVTALNAGFLRIYPTNSRSPLLYGIDAIRLARKLPRPDVITAQDPFETGLVAWWIARTLGVPLHVQVHTDFLSPAYARLSLKNRLRAWIAGFVLRRAARVRVVSERIKDALPARFHLAGSMTVLPIFADIEHIRAMQVSPVLAARFSQFERKVLVVGRLEREKNVALALRSFARSAPHRSCLILVGNGRERKTLQTLAEHLGVSKSVFFEGEQDPALYYSLADLVLVPSRYEGYGLVIVEALAAGKPVISTDVGIAREAGAIIAPPEKFVAALAEWFKSGPRKGELKNSPYENFDDYVRKYCDDIAACAKSQKKE
ncbi:MAG TPA: glycosyltransferase [Candidatus Paceibacterota bacterium]